MTELASRLEAAMPEIRRESRRLGHVPMCLLQILNEQGALVTAHQLLASDRYHDGFSRLWDLRRLDLSLECVVLKPVLRPLRFHTRQLDAQPSAAGVGPSELKPVLHAL